MNTNDDEEDYFNITDEENDETGDPIDPAKPSPNATAQIDTDIPSPITAATIVATKATVFPSAKVPAIVLSISVPRKPLPVTTNYIHPRLDIFGPEYRNIMFGGSDQFKKLTNKCLYIDKTCHTYFSGTGKIFVINCY